MALRTSPPFFSCTGGYVPVLLAGGGGGGGGFVASLVDCLPGENEDETCPPGDNGIGEKKSPPIAEPMR